MSFALLFLQFINILKANKMELHRTPLSYTWAIIVRRMQFAKRSEHNSVNISLKPFF